MQNESFAHIIGKKYGLQYAPKDTHFTEKDYMHNYNEYVRKKCNADTESLIEIMFNMGYVYLIERDKYGNEFELGYGIQDLCCQPNRNNFASYYES